MKILADKLILLVTGLIPLLGHQVSRQEVAAVLCVITVSCICQTLRKGIAKNIIQCGYCVLCFFVPECAFLLALPLYEAVRTRDIPSFAFMAAAAAFGFLNNAQAMAFGALLCGAAAYLCIKTLKNARLQKDLMKARDDSVELERLMKKRNRELTENREYEIRLATLNERNRIAREIHDSVGHLLSRSLLQTGALETVCSDEQAVMRQGLHDLHETLDSAMDSIRESVHGIRDESLDLKLAAAQIISQLQKKLDVSLEYSISDNASPKVKLCFIAILKEAVSNISRHSNGDKASIILREHPALYQLIVSDNGTVKKRADSGMGLEDMKERAEALGGIFRVNTNDGFSVFVSIRKQEQTGKEYGHEYSGS